MELTHSAITGVILAWLIRHKAESVRP